MPGYPTTSPAAEAIVASSFAAFTEELRRCARAPGFVPLHLGDVCLPPPAAARALSLEEPALHRYGPVAGDPALRAACAADLSGLGNPVSADSVFITPGATGGLDVGLSATLAPADEILVLSPSWPLILGLIRRQGGVPVEVQVDPDDAPALLVERLSAACGPRTTGIYLSNPNNPIGFIYTPASLEGLQRFAAERGLWIFYDAVYADLLLAPGRPLEFLAGEAGERTFCVTSFSKTFGLAGARVGALTAPPSARHLIPRLLANSTYHTSNLGQAMALAVLKEGAAPPRAERVRLARRGVALVEEQLKGVLPFRSPEAGAFVFLDLSLRCASGAEALQLLRRCLQEGVSLAPGSAFGAGWERWARLCYTSAPSDRLSIGLERLLAVLHAG